MPNSENTPHRFTKIHMGLKSAVDPPLDVATICKDIDILRFNGLGDLIYKVSVV